LCSSVPTTARTSTVRTTARPGNQFYILARNNFLRSQKDHRINIDPILLYPLNRHFLYLCAHNCMTKRLVQWFVV